MTDVFLRAGEPSPSDVRLRDPTIPDGGGVAYVLSGDNGTYAYTGQASTFTFGRNLAGSNGTYAVTGQSASFVFDRKLLGANGTYTIAGQNAAFTFARTLSGSVGTYSVAGQTASFVFARLLAGDNGIYAVAGQDAALIYAPSVIVGNGGLGALDVGGDPPYFIDIFEKPDRFRHEREAREKLRETIRIALEGPQAQEVREVLEPKPVDSVSPLEMRIDFEAMNADVLEIIKSGYRARIEQIRRESQENEEVFMIAMAL